MAQLVVKHLEGSKYNVLLNGVYPVTTIRRKYETWLVPYANELLEVNNLKSVSNVVCGDNTPILLVK